jgi:hypothetical protein
LFCFLFVKLLKGFDAEVDIWVINNEIWRGHDGPTFKTDLEFCKRKGLWCHAKNVEALQMLLENKIRCFWHQEVYYFPFFYFFLICFIYFFI